MLLGISIVELYIFPLLVADRSSQKKVLEAPPRPTGTDVASAPPPFSAALLFLFSCADVCNECWASCRHLSLL